MSAQASFGPWLRRRRKALDLTQAELARQVGCSTIALRKIEAEERRPSQQIVERLADALGIPAPERPAFLRFARGDPFAAPRAAGAAPPWPARAPRGQLPVPPTPLVGRESEAAQVCRLLLDDRLHLLTLVGPPGIGKTRLALQVALELREHFAQQVCFVALAHLRDPGLVAPLIAQALDLTEAGDQPLLEHLKRTLRDSPWLLLLDNFEQVIDAAALVGDLLAACPRLKVLVTSRETLRLPGEQQYLLPPLAVPALDSGATVAGLRSISAVSLFIARAQAVQPGFELTAENAEAVAALCARLDGLPLAIELIAARIKLLPPGVLLARLESGLGLHADGRRGVPERQRTLYRAIQWSYDLLSSAERALFARLSVFAGGWTLEAAEALGAGEGFGLLEGLNALLDKSLVQRAPDGQDSARFAMLETIRAFAHDKLNASDEAEPMRQRHLGHFLKLAEDAEPELHGPGLTRWLARLDADLDNLRRALEWALDQRAAAALRLAGALGQFWYIRGYLSEGLGWLTRALALESGSPQARAKALYEAGNLAAYQGDTARARAFAESGLALCRASGDAQSQAFMLLLSAHVARQHDDLPQAVSLGEESVALFRSLGHAWGLSLALRLLGWSYAFQSSYLRAAEVWQESLALAEALGDSRSIAFAQDFLGDSAQARGDYPQAQALYAASLQRFTELGSKLGILNEVRQLGELASDLGDYERAASYFQQALALSRETGRRPYTLNALQKLADIAWRQGDYPAAAALLDEALSEWRVLGGQRALARLQLSEAHLARSRAEFEKASALYRQALAVFQAREDKRGAAEALHGLAALALAQDEAFSAARLLSASAASLASLDLRWRPAEQAEFDQNVAVARARLGEVVFAAAWAEGNSIPACPPDSTSA